MKIGFFSTVGGLLWGASEYLWSQSALQFLEDGHEVVVSHRGGDRSSQKLKRLANRGARINYRWPSGVRRRSGRLLRAILRRADVDVYPFGPRLNPYARWLHREQPDFVLISIGYHKDDVAVAAACKQQGIPYAMLMHCANWNDWIDERRLEPYRRAYNGARECFFVSAENRDILEANLAQPLSSTRVICNPLSMRPEAPPAWPSPDGGWRMACVGRMHFRSKGQDLILRVLSQKKWRNRPLTVSFWGRDQDSATAFDALVRRFSLENKVCRPGFSERPLAIWEESHALLLPSRYEGMPMVTPEAMFCARPAVVTACGRNPDFVDDDETGFLAEAATLDLVDDAMERAWQRRHDWEAMGNEARRRIEARYDAKPVDTFVRSLRQLSA